MKRRYTVAVPLVGILALAACGLQGQQNDEPSGEQEAVEGSGDLSGSIDFQTWSLRNETFIPYFEDLIDEFEEAHPDTSINWIDQPGDGYQEQLLQQVQIGELPDVVNLPPDFAYQLLPADALLDLEGAAPDAVDIYTEGGIEAYRFEGHDGVYGYPWYLGTDLAWWNTELMADAGVETSALPATFDEMADIALNMVDNGGLPLFSSAPGVGDLAAEGVDILVDEEFVFNTPEAADILQRYIDLYQAGAMPAEALANDYAGNAELYKQGAVAFTTAGAGFYGELQDNAPSLVDGTVATPRIGAPPLFVQGISVSADSENLELALAFAQFVTNNDNQVELVRLAQGFLPGTAEANADPESFSGAIEDPLLAEAVATAAEAMPDAQVHLPVQWSDAMNTFAQQQISLALRGDISAEDALDSIVENANSTL